MSDKETVVITGGGGFIGAQVYKTFADAGYDVIVIDSGARKWATKNYTVSLRLSVPLYCRNIGNVQT